MTIEAKVIEHSINAQGVEILTFQLKYPRFIHAEVMTHRVFSRNASSSRAVPIKRMIMDILLDTACPIHWGKHQKGMQADLECTNMVVIAGIEHSSKEAWYVARDAAVEVAQSFTDAEYHKQIVNRLLEPFAHISVVVTATNYSNFYWLRCHADAQPEIKMLADMMYEAHMASTPCMLREGEWHLPYVSDEEVAYLDSPENAGKLTIEDLLRASVARCARVSYLTHDGKNPSLEDDLNLYSRLVGGEPLHASPTEHQATPDTMHFNKVGDVEWVHPELSGNFDFGFIQYRKTLHGEYITEYSQ